MSDEKFGDEAVRKLERAERRAHAAELDRKIREALAARPRLERTERSQKVTFYDSTVGITIHNVLAQFAASPQPFDWISQLLRKYFGPGVAIEPEQVLSVLAFLEKNEVAVLTEKGVERRRLLVRSDDGWDVTDERRRVILRTVRPKDGDPGSGWDGLRLETLKTARPGVGG